MTCRKLLLQDVRLANPGSAGQHHTMTAQQTTNNGKHVSQGSKPWELHSLVAIHVECEQPGAHLTAHHVLKAI
jgi:hypothetical protein